MINKNEIYGDFCEAGFPLEAQLSVSKVVLFQYQVSLCRHYTNLQGSRSFPFRPSASFRHTAANKRTCSATRLFLLIFNEADFISSTSNGVRAHTHTHTDARAHAHTHTKPPGVPLRQLSTISLPNCKECVPHIPSGQLMNTFASTQHGKCNQLRNIQYDNIYNNNDDDDNDTSLFHLLHTGSDDGGHGFALSLGTGGDLDAEHGGALVGRGSSHRSLCRRVPHRQHQRVLHKWKMKQVK